jgi:hypothetical protein
MSNQITYIWDCRTTDVYPSYEEFNDVVYNVHWRLTADQIVDEKRYYAVSIGTQTISTDTIEPEGFLPFPSPTDEEACATFLNQVTEWVKEEMGQERIEEMEASLATQIANQINPPSVTLTIGVSEPFIPAE